MGVFCEYALQLFPPSTRVGPYKLRPLEIISLCGTLLPCLILLRKATMKKKLIKFVILIRKGKRLESWCGRHRTE